MANEKKDNSERWQPEGLLIEGESQNLIGSLDQVAQKLEGCLGRPVKVLESSDLGEVKTIALTLKSGEIAEAELSVNLQLFSHCLTASTFCWSSEDSVAIGFGLSVSGHSVFRTYRTQNYWKRFELTLPIPTSIRESIFKIRIRNPAKNEVTVHIAFPCIEPSPRASSPIYPGEHRAADLCDLKDPGYMFYDKEKGTIFFIFRPLLDFHQWDGLSDGTLLGAYSECNLHGINLHLSGTGGYIELFVFDEKQKQEISTKIRPDKDNVYGVAITWDVGRIELFVDGNSMGVLDGLDLDFNGLSAIRIGNHPITGSAPSNILCRHISAYKERFPEWKVKSTFYAIDPTTYSYYQSIREGLSEIAEDRWPARIIEIFFSTANSWQKNPPLWTTGSGLDESHFRDDLSRFLEHEFPTSSESECSDGRTDLLFELPDRKKVRVEFKVWGRHDYDEVPVKPMKYMTDSEEIAIVVMLNKNKSNINRKYVKNVYINSPGCEAHVENPFCNSYGIFHFISEHFVDGKKISILHVVFNTQKPLARSGFLQ